MFEAARDFAELVKKGGDPRPVDDEAGDWEDMFVSESCHILTDRHITPHITEAWAWHDGMVDDHRFRVRIGLVSASVGVFLAVAGYRERAKDRAIQLAAFIIANSETMEVPR